MAGPAHSRRPKLSLQTKPIHHGSSVRSRNSLANVDPKSPTAFNTLSNVYVTAIERSTPTQNTPLTAIKPHQPLKLRTDSDTLQGHQPRNQLSSTDLPNTPPSANPFSPTQKTDIVYPSTMTPTPPLSAGSVDSGHRMFTFTSMETHRKTVLSPSTQSHRRVSFVGLDAIVKAPYSHNRSLRSILRNSPLQSSITKSPRSSRRQSVRLQEKTTRRVGYESPLTRTITTEKYTKTHIELLVEDASPYTPSPVPEETEVDLTMAYSGEEIKDGDQTPGPFEEMRRRMTSLATETPVASLKPDGIRRRKRKEKKRKWVWTIGREDEETESGAMAAIRAAAGEAYTPRATTMTSLDHPQAGGADTPEPLTAIEMGVKKSITAETEITDGYMDVDTSETGSVSSSSTTSPTSADFNSSADYDLASKVSSPTKRQRLTFSHLNRPGTGDQQGTSIPHAAGERSI